MRGALVGVVLLLVACEPAPQGSPSPAPSSASPESSALPLLSPPIVGTEPGPPCPSAPAGTAPPAGSPGTVFTVVPTWPVNMTIGLTGLALAADGTLYLTDRWFNRICRVAPNGTGSMFAGLAQHLNQPTGLSVDSSGRLFIADTGNNRIVVASPDGTVSPFAGNGAIGLAGDGKLAVAAQLNHPDAVAVAPDGTVYVSDTGNFRIRKVAPNGIITTFAGTGVRGQNANEGDGGDALAAELTGVHSLALDSHGRLYVGDQNRVRVIENGVIRGFAGTGIYSYDGDGKPAIQAFIRGPGEALAVGPGDVVYIGDWATCVVRVVNSAGVINRYAGSFNCGYQGDGGPALTGTLFDSVASLAIDHAGNLYVGEYANKRVRIVLAA